MKTIFISRMVEDALSCLGITLCGATTTNILASSLMPEDIMSIEGRTKNLCGTYAFKKLSCFQAHPVRNIDDCYSTVDSVDPEYSVSKETKVRCVYSMEDVLYIVEDPNGVSLIEVKPFLESALTTVGLYKQTDDVLKLDLWLAYTKLP